MCNIIFIKFVGVLSQFHNGIQPPAQASTSSGCSGDFDANTATIRFENVHSERRGHLSRVIRTKQHDTSCATQSLGSSVRCTISGQFLHERHLSCANFTICAPARHQKACNLSSDCRLRSSCCTTASKNENIRCDLRQLLTLTLSVRCSIK